MDQKLNSKWRPSPSWIYFRWLFLTHCRLSTVDRNHHTKFRANIIIHDWVIITFVNSRWRPSAMLDFRKITNWPKYRLRLLIFHHGTKFSAKMLIDAQIMAHKRNSKWRLEFMNSGGYFWHRLQLTFHCWSQPPHKIWCQYLNRRLTYGNFSKFKMAAVRHLGFSKNLSSDQWVALGFWFFVTVPNLVQKCWSTPNLWPKIKIQDGGRPPSWNCCMFM